eukprot:802461_1
MSSQSLERIDTLDTLRNMSESMRRSEMWNTLSVKDECGSPAKENSIFQPKADQSSVKSTVKLETETLATTGDNPLEDALNPNTNSKSTLSFNCFECMRSFKTFGGLSKHLALPLILCGKPYKCFHCNVGFMKQSEFLLHNSNHSLEPKQYACKICGVKIKSVSLREKHSLIHKNKFHCTVCSPVQGFPNKHSLARHMKTHRETKKFICETCSPMQSFHSKRELSNHMKCHQQKSCEFCKKSLSDITGPLKLHVMLHTGERPVTCSSCPARFRSKRELKKHNLWVCVYPCHKCPTKFSSWDALLEHIFKKHSTKHSCSKCNEQFDTLDDLKTHSWKTNGCPSVSNSRETEATSVSRSPSNE